MINQKDLRDIAGYWGAPYTTKLRMGALGSVMLGELVLQASPDYKTFKLHLRSIFSLTDEKIGVLAKLVTGVDVNMQGICRLPDTLGGRPIIPGYYVHLVDGSALAIEIRPDDIAFRHNTNRQPRQCVGAAVAYLQSIGIYVPGTIDPKYVQLIED